jgi:hypothetical protein
MSVSSKRLRALPLAVAVAVAVPLVAPLAANAAMGGANALTTSLRPDLRSATVQSTNTTDDTTTVRVCFSKAIASLPQTALFHMGTYADTFGAGTQVTATQATRSTSNCADAVFPNSDATSFTYVQVDGSDGTAPDGGGSAVSSSGFGNIRDATALIGSKTNNGTRGFGAGPDLVGITVNNAASTIDYTYDQRVGAVSPAAAAFVANLPTGVEVPSNAGAAERALSTDGLTVRVNFPPGSVTNVVRAYSQIGAVVAKAGGAGSLIGHLRSSARPGNGGFTDRPDLIAVNLAADGSYVDYQYDQVLTAVGATGNYFLGLSGLITAFNPGGVPAIVGGAGIGNTVRVTCGPCTAFTHEAQVSGGALVGAATGAGGASTAGGLPVGGNAGAFATGFTSAPEALTVSFDNATSVVSVLFDQRWATDTAAQFKLIDDQGSQIGAAAINVTGGGAPAAGKTTAQITFPAGAVSGARSLLIQAGGVVTGAGFLGQNIQQVISPTAPAAKTARKFRKAKTITRKQRAAIRRSLKRH